MTGKQVVCLGTVRKALVQEKEPWRLYKTLLMSRNSVGTCFVFGMIPVVPSESI